MAVGVRHGRGSNAEPLTDRERELLRHGSDMLNTAEVTSEMYISASTVRRTSAASTASGRRRLAVVGRSAEPVGST